MFSIYKKLKTLFEFRKLKYRFIFFLLIASLIPTIIIGISSYFISKGLVIERETKDAMASVTKLKDDVDVILSQRETIALTFYVNQPLQRLFSKTEENENDKFQIMKLLFASEHLRGNHSIFVSDEYGNIYSNLRAASSSSKSMNYEYSKLMQNSDLDYKWVGLARFGNENVIPYVRVIKSINMNRKLGLVIVNLKESTIFNTYRELLKNIDGDIFILDDKNVIISNQNKDYLGRNFNNICITQNKKGINSNYEEATLNNEKYLLIQTSDTKTLWKYEYLVSLKQSVKGTRSIGTVTILICLLTALLSLIVGITLASRITGPINKLISFMNKVDSGNLNLEYNTDRKDEIGKLANYFNKMIGKMRVSIEEIYNVQKAKRDVELKALVYQINPHFLYNTLSSIIWLANDGDNEKVIEITDSLSKLFRISISKGKEIIKISKEIEHMQSYIKIQQIRYKDKFTCIFDIEDEILDFYTPKLIFQPLIENSIYHGIKNLEEEGIIIVEGKRLDDKICFNVIDNGNAISVEGVNYLNQILSEDIEEIDFGIGIKNVNSRIKLYFGPDYGLSYRKEEDKTIASIIIPILEND